MAAVNSPNRGRAFVIGFRGDPMSDEVRDAPLMFERLGWETHEILLDPGDTLTQLTDEIAREIDPDKPGKDQQLLVFYAGHAMSMYEPQALGTWHAHTATPRCQNHVVQCDPELVFEWLIKDTEFDILFLFNCPFKHGETTFDLVTSIGADGSFNDIRTVQCIILREPFTELDADGRCSADICDLKGDLLRLPTAANRALPLLMRKLKEAIAWKDRFTANELRDALEGYAGSLDNDRPWNFISPRNRDFVLWQKRQSPSP